MLSSDGQPRSPDPSTPDGLSYDFPTEAIEPHEIACADDTELSAKEAMLHSSSKPGYGSRAIRARNIAAMNKYAFKRMALPFVVGCAFAVAQELFLRVAEGKYVESYAVPELAMRAIANVLASLAQFFFLAAITTAIHQMVWWFIRCQRSFMVAQLNVLFNQPSSYLSLTSYPRLFSDLPAATVILLSVTVVQLTNIFGPAALQTAVPPPRFANVSVPAMDWAGWTGGQAFALSSNGQQPLVHPSTSFTNRVYQAILAGSAISPRPPAECTNGCYYTTSFAAPVAKCSPAQATFLQPGMLASVALDGGGNTLAANWRANNGTFLGSSCSFYSGNYTAIVNHTNAGLSYSSTWKSSNQRLTFRQGIGQANSNALAVVAAFTTLLAGNTTMVTSGKFSTTGPMAQTSIFAINDTAMPSTFECLQADVPRALESLFSNVTMSFLGYQGAQQTVQVALLPPPGASIYVVRTMILRLTYIVSGGITLTASILGYLCLRRNGTVRRNCFSAFFETTHTSELSEIADYSQTNRARFYTSKLAFLDELCVFVPSVDKPYVNT